VQRFQQLGSRREILPAAFSCWNSSWERWRLAGKFRFSAPGWLAGRRHSQEVYGEGGRKHLRLDSIAKTAWFV
jgi:hypothetical protein